MGLWHSRNRDGLVRRWWNLAQARVHRPRPVGEIVVHLRIQTKSHILERRVFVIRRGVVRERAEIFRSALNDQRAFECQGRQSAHAPALFCAILELLGQEAALQGKGIEGRKLGGCFASDVEAGRSQGPPDGGLRFRPDVDKVRPVVRHDDGSGVEQGETVRCPREEVNVVS